MLRNYFAVSFLVTSIPYIDLEISYLLWGYKWGWGRGDFSKFSQKGEGGLDFSYKKGGVGKRKGTVSLIFILTSPFQCCLVFRRTNLVWLNLINRLQQVTSFCKNKHSKVNIWYQQIIHSNKESSCEHITVVLIDIYVSVSVCWLLCMLCIICQQTSISLTPSCIKDTAGWVGRGFDNIWKRG